MEPVTQETPEQNQKSNVVHEDGNEKVLEEYKKDFFRLKEEKALAESKLKEYENQFSQMQTQKLKEKEQWQELAQVNETRAKEFEQKYTGLQRALIDDKRNSEIEKAALAKGVDPEYLDFVRDSVSNDVIVETTSTGKIQVSGANEHIENFLKKYPKFKAKGDVPSVNNGNPSIDIGKEKLSGFEVLKLQKDDPAAYKSYMMKRAGKRI